MTNPVERLLAGNDVDFELRIPGYAFRVHSAVLAAVLDQSSDLDLSSGREVLTATNDPTMALRLIQAIYTNQYVEDPKDITPEWAEYLERSQIVGNDGVDADARDDGTESTTSWEDFRWEDSPELFIIHATMHHLAQMYAIPLLASLSFRNFIRDTSFPHFSPDQLLWTLEFLYMTSPEPPFSLLATTHKLRMRAIYLAQRLETSLHQPPYLRKFTILVQQSAALAMDLLTKCLRNQYLQCPFCEATFKPNAAEGECDCGGEGVCVPCVQYGSQDCAWRNSVCHDCSPGRLGRWRLDAVENVDISSVKALEGVFHPYTVG
ncbi:hypothetical protein H2200_004308 [Cladophialophora chaetospira]|uniref:Uncharacterized protein n=1 Tax=Cladophialophora chaetospira TaxID=386627 RepID=A0AA38XD22_9EURO|nr:hypothetical protein H2200_004308 [Cladophialophora chaetospira]